MRLLPPTLLLFSLLIFSSACRQELAKQGNLGVDKVSPKATATPTPTPGPEVSVTDFISTLPELKSEEARGIRSAWTGIPKHGQYRVVRSDEFQDSIKPYEYGEIAGAYGLALLIANRTKHDNDRFSLIIFIRRPGNRYDTYWIFRDMDLRGYSLSRASGSVYVEDKLEGKRRTNCRIEWSKAKRQWNCNPYGGMITPY